MTEHITDEEIAELERLEKDATPGNWAAGGNSWGGMEWRNYEVKTSAGSHIAPRRVVANCRYGNDAGQQDAEFIAAARNMLPRLLTAYKALKAENEELRSTEIGELSTKYVELVKRTTQLQRQADEQAQAVQETVVVLEAELERTRNLCVDLESHIADSSLARFRHENVDRFIPEPGYPNGTDSEIDVASPFEIHPEGVPQR